MVVLNKNIFFLLFTLLLQQLAAQKSVRDIEGVVIAKSNDVSGVHIINITTGKATISTENGYFSIPINLNDMLVFSAVQFKEKQILVTRDVLNGENLRVKMVETLIELNEVVLNKRILVTNESLGLPNTDVKKLPQSKRFLHDANHGKFVYYYGIGFVINLNKILNALSGRTKMLKKRVARDQKYIRSQNMRSSYSDSIFKTDLKIPILKIEEFMLFCETNDGFNAISKSKNRFIVWDFLVKRSIEFRKLTKNN